MPKDDCRVNIAYCFAPFPQKTLPVFGTVHLQGTLQESGQFWLKYWKAEAERSCLGALLSCGQDGQGHPETQQSNVGKPCRHNQSLPQWGLAVLGGSRAQHRAWRACGKLWKSDTGSRRGSLSTSCHPSSGKGVRHRQLPPNPGWSRGSWCLTMPQQANISVLLLPLYLLVGPPCPRLLPTTKGILRQGLRRPHGSCLCRRQPDVLLVVHLETPLRRWRLYCPCTVKTLSQLLCSFLVLFLKNILLYCYSSPSSFKLETFVPTCIRM